MLLGYEQEAAMGARASGAVLGALLGADASGGAELRAFEAALGPGQGSRGGGAGGRRGGGGGAAEGGGGMGAVKEGGEERGAGFAEAAAAGRAAVPRYTV